MKPTNLRPYNCNQYIAIYYPRIVANLKLIKLQFGGGGRICHVPVRFQEI